MNAGAYSYTIGTGGTAGRAYYSGGTSGEASTFGDYSVFGGGNGLLGGVAIVNGGSFGGCTTGMTNMASSGGNSTETSSNRKVGLGAANGSCYGTYGNGGLGGWLAYNSTGRWTEEAHSGTSGAIIIEYANANNPVWGLYDSDNNLVESFENLGLSETVYNNGTENWSKLNSYGTGTKLVLPRPRFARIGGAAYTKSNIAEVVISPGTKVIQSSAFDSCYYLERITIPTDVVIISDYALSRVGDNVGKPCEIIYEGTFAQWQAITKSIYWGYGSNFTLYFTDHDPISYIG